VNLKLQGWKAKVVFGFLVSITHNYVSITHNSKMMGLMIQKLIWISITLFLMAFL